METITKKKVAGRMNPLFGKENRSLSSKNKLFTGEMKNSRLLTGDVSKYRGSVEDELESTEGWVPGLRRLFDTALQNKDRMAVKALLPNIPKEYADSFSGEISNILKRH